MIIERELSDTERSTLLRELDQEAMREDLWSAGKVWSLRVLLVISLLLEVLFVTQFEAAHRFHSLLGYAMAAVAAVTFCAGAVALFLLWVHWRWERQETTRLLDFHQSHRPRINAVLEEGRVRAFRFEAKRAILFEEFEDEGSVFVFENSDERSLLIAGQCVFPLYPPRDPWPGQAFELVESADGSEFLGIFGDGQELDMVIRPRNEVCDEIETGTSVELKSAPFDVRLVDLPLEDCLSKLAVD